jgi:hypothetical protein
MKDLLAECGDRAWTPDAAFWTALDVRLREADCEEWLDNLQDALADSTYLQELLCGLFPTAAPPVGEGQAELAADMDTDDPETFGEDVQNGEEGGLSDSSSMSDSSSTSSSSEAGGEGSESGAGEKFKAVPVEVSSLCARATAGVLRGPGCRERDSRHSQESQDSQESLRIPGHARLPRTPGHRGLWDSAEGLPQMRRSRRVGSRNTSAGRAYQDSQDSQEGCGVILERGIPVRAPGRTRGRDRD